jgi:hypothetical protein
MYFGLLGERKKSNTDTRGWRYDEQSDETIRFSLFFLFVSHLRGF